MRKQHPYKLFIQHIDYYLKANREQSKRIGIIFLDRDNDMTTGGKELFSKVGGFESTLNIGTGVTGPAKGGTLMTVYMGTGILHVMVR